MKVFLPMVQSVALSRCFSQYATKALSRSAGKNIGSNLAKAVGPLLLTTVGLIAAKNNTKNTELPLVNEKKNINLDVVEYSASARLKDLGVYKDDSETPINSKDSNKWTKVFRA